MIFNQQEAADYDQWYETRAGALIDQLETELVFRLLKPSRGEKILDAGCGTGNFSIKLAKKGCQVTGIDVSEPMLKKAREKARKSGEKIEFYQRDVIENGFKDKKYDAVLSVTAIEFIADIDKAFLEMMRVIKPGGRVLIATIRKDSEWGEFYQEQARKRDTVFRHASFRTAKELIELDPENLIETGECLFFSPGTTADEIIKEEKKGRKLKKKGGFFCSIWKKPQ